MKPEPVDKQLEELQQRLGHRFAQPALLERAMTHQSCLQDKPELKESNQRLEFLGDSVLQLCLTKALFDLYPEEREGVLSKRRATLSKGVFLTRLARQLGIDACLRVGQSEEATGGRQKASALEDAFEALVGAVYVDSDFETTRRVLLALYGDLRLRLDGLEELENPKGRLQELVQPRLGNNAVRYEVIAVIGEDHARQYEVAVFVENVRKGIGRGSSKKSAEETAARMALLEWNQSA